MNCKVRVFSDHTEALMARDYLESEGISCQVTGVREYTSIVMGGDFGNYQIEVSPDDLTRATQLLSKKESDSQMTLETLTNKSPDYYLRRAVIYAICAVLLLPIICNYTSIRQLWFYVKMRPSQKTTPLFVVGISLLQLPGLFVGYIMLKGAIEYFIYGKSFWGAI